MIERIVKLLNENSGVSDYRINSTSRASYELFFVHRDLETVRSTETVNIKVTVFSAHNGKLGDATFTVYSSYTDEKIAEEIAKALKKAELVNNEPYALPANETGEFVSDSNMREPALPELGAQIADAVFAADCYENGSINALEVFVYRDTVRVCNSRGIDKTEVKYSAMAEAIPTWSTPEESVELYECHNFTELDREAIREEIDSKMREVRDRSLAKKPTEQLSCNVVLAAPELRELFGEIAYNLTFAGLYQHANAYKVGDEIQKDRTGDALTLTARGRMKGSVQSAAFDDDGFTMRDRCIIQNGVAKACFGSVRYASYVGEEPTGALGCIEVDVGTMGAGELCAKPYFRCASMSGLQVDIYNDYIGGEVRLGYYFDGTCEIPVTGISISGKLSACLAGMRLSDTEAVYESYKGPKYAVFGGIEIV